MKLLKKIDQHILTILLVAFAFFIPLYPKFPFHVVNYTYISIRLDDFMTALLVCVFIIQLLRRKVSLKHLIFKKWFLAFWFVVFASFLSGVYVTKTIDYPFVGLLHAIRRVEYMIVFFIAMASIKTVRDFKIILYSLLASLFLVNVYGLGQRFFDFPAVSTMNPEFAKGRVLILTPEARLTSTFAGHYDLGAFLVFMFPIAWSVFFYKNKFLLTLKEKSLVFTAGIFPTLLSMYSLITPATMPSFMAALIAALTFKSNLIILGTMAFSFLLYIVMTQYLLRQILFANIIISIIILVFTASRSSSIAYLASTSLLLLSFKKFKFFFLVLAIAGVFTYMDSDLLQRWLKTVQIKQIILNEKTGEEVVVQRIRSDELPAGTSFIKSRKNSRATTDSELLRKELIDRATLSGRLNLATTAADYQTVTAYAADISIATRFQVSWPRAIKAFQRNPLLGTGASSITESSDGDYVRWIGETGILGFVLFVGIILAILKTLFDARKIVPKGTDILLFGVIFGTFGLFINAILIDVFEASKVAYILWLTLGAYIGLVRLDKKELGKL